MLKKATLVWESCFPHILKLHSRWNVAIPKQKMGPEDSPLKEKVWNLVLFTIWAQLSTMEALESSSTAINSMKEIMQCSWQQNLLEVTCHCLFWDFFNQYILSQRWYFLKVSYPLGGTLLSFRLQMRSASFYHLLRFQFYTDHIKR